MFWLWWQFLWLVVGRQYTPVWGAVQYRISVRNISWTGISRNLVRRQLPSQLSNWFEILHRARQYHCRAPCKKSKRLLNWQKRLWANEISRDLGSYIAQHSRVASMASGQSHDCPGSSEVTLNDMGIYLGAKHNTPRKTNNLCTYFVGGTVMFS